ncbi:TPA: HigA family addiction module antidote protein [Burkholderia cepacia]|nr:HigA family addiction module antidote protein [Burkholderia cepacia]
MNRIFNPPHPGETLRDDVLPALGLTVTEAASQLGVTRAALSRILHGHAGISPEMALRLEAWLGEENGGRAYLWLAQQSAHDLWRARRARRRWRGRRRAHDAPPANVFRRGQYRLGSPAGRVLKRL